MELRSLLRGVRSETPWLETKACAVEDYTIQDAYCNLCLVACLDVDPCKLPVGLNIAFCNANVLRLFLETTFEEGLEGLR